MHSPLASNSMAIEKARNEFLRDGTVKNGEVDSLILRSWQRCFDSGVDAAKTSLDHIETAYEQRIRQEKSHILLTHAKPEMVTLCEQISATGSIVLLTDAEGVVLHHMGNPSFMSTAQKVALRSGCSWNENHRGTNAIGTALIEKTAVHVHGAEHFVARNHILSCSAVPIFTADHETLGILDVSNHDTVSQRHTLSLVKMAAQLIENRLFNASFNATLAIHFHARPEFIGTLWEGVALLDDEGQVLAINRSGLFQLGLNKNLSGLNTENLFNQTISGLKHETHQSLLTPLHLNSGFRVYAKIRYANESREELPRSNPVQLSRTGKTNNALSRLNTGDKTVARALEQVQLVLDQNIPILIEGETGVGKELLAQAIHEASQRSKGNLVAINCASLPEGLIESELFGYEEGAFTGARRKGCVGKIEQAHGGTLFLDEIGDMPLSLQARLLRVLQERRITPLGSNRSEPVDITVISATNQNLRENVERGLFRRDLYYRLNGLTVCLPALRDRSDLPTLIQRLLEVEGAAEKTISSNLMKLFLSHPWPGNIRQLHSVLRTALALSTNSTEIAEFHLTQHFLDEANTLLPVEKTTKDSLNAITCQLVESTLQQHHGNVTSAARQLGISRNTFYRKLRSKN